MSNLGGFVLIIGLALVAVGVFLLYGPSIPWLGRLPGDIRVEGQHSVVYFPLATCLVLSVLFSAAMWVFNSMFRR